MVNIVIIVDLYFNIIYNIYAQLITLDFSFFFFSLINRESFFSFELLFPAFLSYTNFSSRLQLQLNNYFFAFCFR